MKKKDRSPYPADRRKVSVGSVVRAALQEDIGGGDVTSNRVIPSNRKALALIVAKERGVLCGIEAAREAFRQVDKKLRFAVIAKDGTAVRAGQVCARITGSARSILTAERTALNLVQQLSGVATLTRKFVDEVQGTRARIYDTRKTVPGLRALQKLAVRCGGGENHRMGLHDGVLVKENHLALGGTPVGPILRQIRKSTGKPVEVEAQNWAEVERLSELPIDMILLDNFPLGLLRRAVRFLRRRRPRLILEASGGVNLRTVRAIAKTGVDRISVGALTHSAPAMDFSLDVGPL